VNGIFVVEQLTIPYQFMLKVESKHSEFLNIDPSVPELKELLDDSARHLLALFCEHHLTKWRDLIDQRSATHALIRSGQDPELLRATEHIRNSNWQISELPHDLQERRVELVLEPTSEFLEQGMHSGAKTIVLNSDALAIFSGSMFYKAHLRINALIQSLEAPGSGLLMHPTLMMRPRSFDHFSRSVTYKNTPVPGLFIDLAIYLNNNVSKLLSIGSGPYFSIAGVQGHLEARLVNDLFDLAQIDLNIPRGTIKATVLLDNILTTFEMDEIIFELSHHSAGMALNKWALYNSFLEFFGERNGIVCPDRRDVRTTSVLLRNLSLNMIATCHERGAHAIGWMIDELPVESRESEFYHRIVAARKEKELEVVDGHDGTQVQHPGMVNMATEEFNRFMPRMDQLNYSRSERPHPKTLVMPFGEISIEGVQKAIYRALCIALAHETGHVSCTVNGRTEGSASYDLAITQLKNWVNSPDGVITKTHLEIDNELIQFLVNKSAIDLEKVLDRQEKLLLKKVCQEFLDGIRSETMVKAAI